MRYEITVMRSGIHQRKEVEGIPVRFAGFDELEAFMYQADGTYALGDEHGGYFIDASQIKGKYLIAEETTGRYIDKPFAHPQEAYNHVADKLKELGKDRVSELLSRARAMIADGLIKGG